MAGKPAEPPQPGHRAIGAQELATGASVERRALEHTGPIAIERYVKDDGRALILYFDERTAADPPRRA